jgi:secreted PhoX family phosphatase
MQDEDSCVNPSAEPTIATIISRRAALRGLMAGAAVGALGIGIPEDAEAAGPSTLGFKELTIGHDETDHVAEGYEIQVLLRWGDPVVTDAPPFEIGNLTAAAQERQFGYNNDFLGFHPLPYGSTSSEHGLLSVNHEYTNTNLIFAGVGEGRGARLKSTRPQAEVELAAHGMSVVEIRRQGGQWQVVQGSRFNRRITGTTPMEVAGPAAGHARLKTNADPDGRRVLGTLNNCSAGVTPWGTVLTGEENINGYFGGDAEKLPDAALYKRYGVSKNSWYSWPQHFERFNVEKEPNEPNRFGWIVEVDPYEPDSVPVKHTALGRFKHETATTVVNHDGRVVAYSGDDEANEYVYKFVSNGRYDAADRAANKKLLDDGTLYVAQFLDDGTLKWLPLVHGEGPLTAENGFADQGEVVVNARRAADLLKATPMDRPEDIETNPLTGRVYVALTNNTRRTAETVNKANPRPNNEHGHVLEIIPPGGKRPDHAATEAKWEVFIMGGRPGIDAGARYHRAVSENGWLSSPDNVAFDAAGRIWISTDSAGKAGIADGVWAADTTGRGRALTRLFYQAPVGAEVCGPCFTPDNTTLFLAIQHPGEEPGSTFEQPATRWPDFKDGMPPRPSVVAITKTGGGVVGT